MVLEPELDVAGLELGELEAVLAPVQVLADLLDQVVVGIGLDGEVVLERGHLADRVDEDAVASVADAAVPAVPAVGVLVGVVVGLGLGRRFGEHAGWLVCVKAEKGEEQIEGLNMG